MIRNLQKLACLGLSLILLFSCQTKPMQKSAKEILGNANYQAIAYGGYRNHDRSKAPSVEQIMEDMQLLHAMGIRVIRTYHARLYEHAPRTLEAIHRLKAKNPQFEMYVMLGCWMQCQNAWTETPNHNMGDTVNNQAEINQAITLAQKYPDIVKIIAVGNEAMVHWAATYYVVPKIILNGVKRLQEAKAEGVIDSTIWITSSDNFASWGGEAAYQTSDLAALVQAVDYVSVHSYPFHDTHYNPEFWYVPEQEEGLAKKEQINCAMQRSLGRVKMQLALVKSYLDSLGVDKKIHIGETGWASKDNNLYGAKGSHAADPYKQSLYYQLMRDFTNKEGYSCFYFEAFNEPWKDQDNVDGSENHFGLFTVGGQAKWVLHQVVEKGVFEGLGRNGQTVTMAQDKKLDQLAQASLAPPFKSEQPVLEIIYPALKDSLKDAPLFIFRFEKEESLAVKHPSGSAKLEVWEETCALSFKEDKTQLLVKPKPGEWWGGALKVAGVPQDYTLYQKGSLHLEYKANYSGTINLGFMSGSYGAGTQKRAQAELAVKQSDAWQTFSIPLAEITQTVNLKAITSLLFLQGNNASTGDSIQIKNLVIRP
jgi:exo-beta-1,3-glucanase (GH17 family)